LRIVNGGTLTEQEQNRIGREQIWNGYGTGTELIWNGKRTGTGTHVEWQQNVFCHAFPVRFLLISTV